MEEKKIEETIEKTEEGLGKRNRLIDRAEFKLGLTIFIAGALLIIFYQIVAHYTGFKSGLVNLGRIISPFVYGFVMAYLLSPVYS